MARAGLKQRESGPLSGPIIDDAESVTICRYRLPGGDCAFIDDDGKCHPKKKQQPLGAASSTAGPGPAKGLGLSNAILKEEVPGVAL